MPWRKTTPSSSELEALRTFVEYCPFPIAMVDRDLRYLCTSARWRKFSRSPDHSLAGVSHFDAFPFLEPKWRAVCERCLKGATERADRELIRLPDGSAQFVRWEIRPWNDTDGNIGGLLMFSENITEDVLSLESEHQSAIALRTFFDAAPYQMGIFQLEGEVIRFLRVNQTYVIQAGLASVADTEGKTAQELPLTPSGGKVWKKNVALAREQGVVHFEYDRGDEHAGQIFYMTLCEIASPDPERPRFCFIGRDVTEDHRRRTALVESEERLAFALDATDEAVFDFDVPTGRLVASPRVAAQLGMSVADIGESVEFFNSLTHPDDQQHALAALQDLMVGKIPMYEAEYRMRHKDGHYIWFHTRGKIVKRDPEGRPIRMVGTQVDITKRKEAEAELRLAKDQAQAALATKSAFLANISHEIRTPLTSILGYADMLREASLPADKRTQYVEVIRRSGEHLLSLINDILDLSKIEANRTRVERIPCELPEAVGEVASLIRTRATTRQVKFESDLGQLPAQIFTDPTRLRQILTNLLDNAVKFTRAGGQVKLLVTLHPADSATGRDMLRFDIIDTGIGISREQLSRLFQPFVQADSSTTRQFGGTGLGLAISLQLARMLGGDITVESSLGAGSRFTLSLPFDVPRADESPLPGPPATADAPPPTLSGRILLVEDGEDNQLLLNHVLQRAGAIVDLATTGPEAIDKVARATTAGMPYDLILMDIQMPGMDGNEATRRLRAKGTKIPIIALSASAMPANRELSRSAGCNDFLAKPIDFEELVQTLHRWMHA